MAIIYHLAIQQDWESAGPAGEYRVDSLAQEGFIHCSKDEAQMLGVANRLFTGLANVLVLEVDTERLTSPVKHEPSRSGEVYPHIYGPLNNDAVVKVARLLADAQGKFFGTGG